MAGRRRRRDDSTTRRLAALLIKSADLVDFFVVIGITKTVSCRDSYYDNLGCHCLVSWEFFNAGNFCTSFREIRELDDRLCVFVFPISILSK